MTYQDYKKAFSRYNSQEGYILACRFLAFENNEWLEFGQYSNRIASFLKRSQASKGTLLNIVDACCGEYSWIPRYFSDKASKIYCIDLSPEAVKKASLLSPKVIPIAGDVSNEVRKLEEVDAIYCGFNVYPHFINPFANALKKGGSMFLMKPKTGDDITIRNLVKGYDLNRRLSEIDLITSKIRISFDLNYEEANFNWKFVDKNIDEVLAAMSVVSLGDISLLTDEQYALSINYLKSKSTNNAMVLEQTVSIWQGVKL